MKITQQFINCEDNWLFTVAYSPEIPINEIKRGCIFIHSFGEEKKNGHRNIVETLQAVCNEKQIVIMFDLYGCGDSEGDLADASITLWIKNIGSIYNWLIENYQLNSIYLMGLRMGASLACLAEQRYNWNTNLILLEPIGFPLQYLKGLLKTKMIKELLTAGKVSFNRDEVLQNLSDEHNIDFDGHVVSHSFFYDLLEYNEVFKDKILQNYSGLLRISSITNKQQVTKNVKDFLSFMAVSPACVSIINSEPFWDKINVTNNENLINSITNFIKSDKS